jgi:hypothetical protein
MEEISQPGLSMLITDIVEGRVPDLNTLPDPPERLSGSPDGSPETFASSGSFLCALSVHIPALSLFPA